MFVDATLENISTKNKKSLHTNHAGKTRFIRYIHIVDVRWEDDCETNGGVTQVKFHCEVIDTKILNCSHI